MNDSLSNRVPAGRIALIDSLRGLSLVLMTIDHLPSNPLERLTWQPFGFVSAAEAFVFLSGIVTGSVYGRSAVSQGISTMTGRAFRRLRTIYFTNVIFLSLSMLVASRGYASLGDGVRPSWALWEKSMVLVLAPSYSEILRLYCIFFLFVPLILWALVEDHMRPVLIISSALWCLAKSGYGMTAVPNSGYFDLVSWQLLFVVGICFGFQALKKEDAESKNWLQRVFTYPAIVVVIVLFAVRHERFFTGTSLSPYWSWLSSWRRTLPLARLLNFSAVAFLIYQFRRSLELLLKNPLGRAFIFLGRHSLPVFVWSVSVGMLACASTIYPKWMASSHVQQGAWALLILASCFLPAWFHLKWQQASKVINGKLNFHRLGLAGAISDIFHI